MGCVANVGEDRNAYILTENPPQRDQFLSGRTLQKSILKLFGKVVAGFIFHRIGTGLQIFVHTSVNLRAEDSGLLGC